AASLEGKPFTDWQKERLMVTTVGKVIINQIMPEEFPYLNEPTTENLIERTPDKYFIEHGVDVKEAIKEMDLVPPFKKKQLSNVIAEVFKRYQVTETSIMLEIGR